MALASLSHPLSLDSEHYLPKSENMLLIREIFVAEVIDLMSQWQLFLPDSTLNVWMERFSCAMAQAQIMWQLYRTIIKTSGLQLVVVTRSSWIRSTTTSVERLKREKTAIDNRLDTYPC